MLDQGTTLLFTDVDDETNTFVITVAYIELIHEYDDGLSKWGVYDANGTDYVELYEDCQGRLTSPLGWTITKVDE